MCGENVKYCTYVCSQLNPDNTATLARSCCSIEIFLLYFLLLFVCFLGGCTVLDVTAIRVVLTAYDKE